jgi:hypothetical protein
MKKIFKYRITFGKTVLYIPKGTQLLTVQLQNNQPHIWAIVDESQEVEERAFFMVPTGEGTNQTLDSYIGTHTME